MARLLAHGAAVALWVCVAGFGVVAAPVLIAWLGAGAVEPMADVLSVAATGWLLGMGVTLSTPDAYWGLTPLALTLVSVLLAYRGGLWAAESTRPGTGSRIGTLLASTTLTAAALGGIVAAAVSSDGLRIDPGEAASQAGLVTLTGMAAGVLLADAGWRPELSRRFPAWVGAALRPAMAALAVLLAAAAALTTVALVASFGTITALLDQLAPGVAGLVALLLLCLAYLPTLLVWVLAVAVGPGVSLGAVVSVSGSGVSLGPLPGFPLLGVAPEAMPGWVPAVGIASVVLAGLLAGLMATGRAAGSEAPPAWQPAASAALAGVAVGLAVAFASWASSDAMGPGDLSWVGVQAGQVGAMVGAAVASTAATTAAVIGWRRARRLPQSPSRDASDSFSAS